MQYWSQSAWRIVIGVSLVPAFGTLYQRLALPESRRYKAAQEARELDEIADLKAAQKKDGSVEKVDGLDSTQVLEVPVAPTEHTEKHHRADEKAHFGGAH